jgi:DNA-binding GntR family transcriptional regulator
MALSAPAIWPEIAGLAPPGDPGYWRFLQALLDGRLKLGETLRQEDLCEVLGMSLSPLRETMTLLAAEGLVEVRRRMGVRIFYPDVPFVRTTFQLRGVLEREGLRKLAQVVTDDWLDRMIEEHRQVRALVSSASRAADYELAVKKVEQELHGSFVAVFQNPLIEEVHGKLFRKLYLLRLMYPASVNPRPTLQSLDEHLAIVEALRVRDGQRAADALDRHLAAVLHRILDI